MPALPNPKHELFARELAKGATATAAYKVAFGNANRSGASRRSRDADVLTRVAELQAAAAAMDAEATRAAAERLSITKERVLDELRKIAFSDIRCAVRWGATVMVPGAEGGEEAHTDMALIPSDQIDQDTAAAISEIRQTREGLAFKLHDKRAALVDLGKHLGLFPRQVELSGKGGGPIMMQRLEDLSDAELMAIAAGETLESA